MRRTELLALARFWLRRPDAARRAMAVLDDVRPDELALAARVNGMAALTLEVLEGLGPPAAGHAASMREAARGEAVLSLELQPALEEIADAARSAGLRAVLVKGLALDAAVYPRRGLRPAGDLDILIDAPEAPRWEELMRRLGYKLFPAVDRTWQRAGRESVDLHRSSSDLAGVIDVPEELSPLRLDPPGIVGRAREVAGLPLPVPCPEDHLLIVAAHGLLVHLFERLVWLMDAALLLPLAADRALLADLARHSGAARPLCATLEILARLDLADAPADLLEALRPARRGRIERGMIARLARGGELPDRSEFVLALFSASPPGYRGLLLRRALLPRRRALASHGAGAGAAGILRHASKAAELALVAARCALGGG